MADSAQQQNELDAAASKPSRKKGSGRSGEPTIVGIGASAGGLEALRELVAHLPDDAAFTYVVAQHLSPTHTSLLMELLARETRLKVQDIQSGRRPEPNTIYITPPNHDVEVRKGLLRLTKPRAAMGPRPSINHFFTSLAADQGGKAVGIILSGTGSDGASGLQAIKAADGVTMVQDLGTAKYDGMPRAAIRTGAIDLILPPHKMGDALASLSKLASGASPEVATLESSDVFENIISTVLHKSGFDLGQYKMNTVQRRIRRRMGLYGLPDFERYLEYLRGNADEAARLIRDVFISVTAFFRDKDAFEALKPVVARVLAAKGMLEPIRVWVAGCATGEEAYSIAMLFEEAIRTLNEPRKYQIFATDIDASVTAHGRRGMYSHNAVEGIIPELRQRYFEPVGTEFQIIKPLRDRIVFAQHNLTVDPPFSRVDLISCRNLLIYFTPPFQRRVLELFHYALAVDGYLFLGKSESINTQEGLFSTVNKSARLFRKRNGRTTVNSISGKLENSPAAVTVHQKGTVPPTLEERIEHTLAEAYGPTSIVVAENDEILYGTGDVKSYMQIVSGPTRLNVFDLIHETMRVELRALLYKCRREGSPVQGTKLRLDISGGRRVVRMVARPLAGETDNLVLVCFEPEADVGPALPISEASKESEIIRELEHELAANRAHLQTVIEELETSNEELQSLNEELQSSNEELQATNEELQTSNEELQSTNEELLTVNEELQVKSAELEIANSDLLNIKRSVDFPLLVVDRHLALTRYNPAAGLLFPTNLVSPGDHLGAIPWHPGVPSLRPRVSAVIQGGASTEEPIHVNGRDYQMRVMPYKDVGGETNGAVLTFIDVTEYQSIESKLLENEQLSAIFNQSFQFSVLLNASGEVLRANEQATQLFDAPGMLGKPYWEAPCWACDPLVQAALKNAIERAGAGQSVRGEFQACVTADDGKVLDLSIKPVLDKTGRVVFLIAEGRDITPLKDAERSLFDEKERAQVTLQSIGDAVITTDIEGQIDYINPIAEALTGWRNEQAHGKPHDEVIRLINAGTREPIESPVMRALRTGEIIELREHVLLIDSQGNELSVEDSAAPIRGRDGNIVGAVLVFHDVTERQNMLREVSWQASHDPLTGLMNRRGLEYSLEQCLGSAATQGRQHAFLYIDLDQFKIVNDTCGHVAGDELLRQIGTLLHSHLRSRDTLARLGGDEFGVVLEGCSIEKAEEIGKNLLKTLQNFRFVWQDRTFALGASIGIVEITRDSRSLSQIMCIADAACYIAKEKGRNRVHLYRAEDSEVARHRGEMEWVGRLNNAFAQNRFRLYSQDILPVIQRNDGVVRRELLVRLEEDDGTLIPPMAFIPAAERYSLMPALDRWVIRAALKAWSRQAGSVPHNLILFINISGATLGDEEFLDFVIGEFRRHKNVPPQQICFELTETTAVANLSKARQLMLELKKLGCQFALDDFGSGMSSFGYLKNLPVDYVKIDGAFVRDLKVDPIDRAMVESINRIGHLMGIQTIAEYVEEPMLLDELKSIGVDYAQGFSISEPTPMPCFPEDGLPD